MIYLSCILSLILFISSSFANNLSINKGLKVAIWNANSGMELREVCRTEKIDILIVEALQVQPFNGGKSQCLKMLSMAKCLKEQRRNCTTSGGNYLVSRLKSPKRLNFQFMQFSFF